MSTRRDFIKRIGSTITAGALIPTVGSATAALKPEREWVVDQPYLDFVEAIKLRDVKLVAEKLMTMPYIEDVIRGWDLLLKSDNWLAYDVHTNYTADFLLSVIDLADAKTDLEIEKILKSYESNCVGSKYLEPFLDQGFRMHVYFNQFSYGPWMKKMVDMRWARAKDRLKDHVSMMKSHSAKQNQ